MLRMEPSGPKLERSFRIGKHCFINLETKMLLKISSMARLERKYD